MTVVRNTRVNQQLMIVVRNTCINQQLDNSKKYLCKSTINNSGLVGEEIYTYTKFTYTTELNNI